jgi:2-oxoglutarate dehydrogenase E1 component
MFQNSMKQRMTWEEFHGPNLGYVLELYDQYTSRIQKAWMLI